MPARLAQPTDKSRPRTAYVAVLAAAIVVLTVAVYWPATRAGFIWDDQWLVTENSNLHDLSGLGQLWRLDWSGERQIPDYYPVTWTSFWLEWQFWGDKPAGYHVTNIALHAVSAVLVWWVLAELGLPWAWAWAAAAIFAVHPINVDSVAWIAERKNTLSMPFYLASILLFARFERRGNWLLYGLSLGAFVLALLSKTSVVMLPVVLIGLIWWRRGKVGWRDWLIVAPFVVLAAGASVVSILYQANAVIRGSPIRGAGENFFFRLAVAGIAPWFYLLKLIVPYPMAAVYPRWVVDPKNILHFLPGAALIGLLVLFWRFRRGWGRGPFAALAYFIAAMFPVLGFFDMYYQVYSFVANHWVYISMISIVALAMGGAALLCRHVHWIVPASVTAAVVCALGAGTRYRCETYRSSETLWRYNIAKYPDHFLPHYNLGKAMDDEGLTGDAIAEYRESIRLNPRFDRPFVNIGRLLAKRGEAALAAGKGDDAERYFTEALIHFQQAVMLYPGSVTARMNLGAMLHLLGRSHEAVVQLRLALEIQEDSPGVHANLATILTKMGDIRGAIRHTRRVVELQPDDMSQRLNLIRLLAKAGRVDECIHECLRLFEIDPNNSEVHYVLAMQLRLKNAKAAAIHHFRLALAADPANVDARNNLAVTLVEAGDIQGAMEQFQLALRYKPDNPEVLSNIAFALSQMGKMDEAIGYYRRALAARPDWPSTLNSLAWLLATRPGHSDPDAAEAIELAKRACGLTGNRRGDYMETLAVACFQAGQRAEAVAVATRASELAKAAGDDARAARLAKLIAEWSAGQPTTEPAPSSQ